MEWIKQKSLYEDKCQDVYYIFVNESLTLSLMLYMYLIYMFLHKINTYSHQLILYLCCLDRDLLKSLVRERYTEWWK